MSSYQTLLAEYLRPPSSCPSFEVIDQSHGHAHVQAMGEGPNEASTHVMLFLEDAGEGDMVLIKNPLEPLKPNDTYHLWQVVKGELKQLKQIGNWRFNSFNGVLSTYEDPSNRSSRPFCIYDRQWGYFQVLQENWEPTKYLAELCAVVGANCPEDCWENYGIANALSRLVQAEEQVEEQKQRLAYRENCDNVVADHLMALLTNDHKNPLATLARSKESTISHPAQAIVNTLHEIQGTLIGVVNPKKLILPDNYLKPKH